MSAFDESQELAFDLPPPGGPPGEEGPDDGDARLGDWPEPPAEGELTQLPPSLPSEELSNSQKDVMNDMGIRKKYRQLDPKSQKDLDERAFIPTALTSKADFNAMFGRYKAKWAGLCKDTHGIEIGKVYDVLTLTEQKLGFVGPGQRPGPRIH